MRIDIITIFPEYFGVLDVSLMGKARQSGLIDVGVHDLREFTTDRHRTVDDTPYGGGAGMVMKAEPWALALDSIVRADGTSTVVFPTPSGTVFTQRSARELSEHTHLVFACGRYEGIDARVPEYAASIASVRELSLGDYVLNGGEVASMAMIEAVARLIPGMVGNPDSLAEESHEGGLLEYPNFTKPALWRDREVPEVLLSGNHARISGWRRDQQIARTAAVRPDLLATEAEDAPEPPKADR